MHNRGISAISVRKKAKTDWYQCLNLGPIYARVGIRMAQDNDSPGLDRGEEVSLVSLYVRMYEHAPPLSN